MKYDVLTLDTQVFNAHGFDLDNGYLAQLKQFKTGPTRVVLSAVVVLELRKQLADKIRETRDEFESAARRALKYGLRSPAGPDFKLAEGTARDLAHARVNDYIAAIGATIVPVDLVSVEDVMRRYFTPAPPFSAAGKKKAEFPDAVALLTLEAWAQKREKKVLAVSKDADWAAFAAGAQHLEIVDNLPDALSLVQDHGKEARAIVQSLLAELSTGDTSSAKAFEKLLGYEIDEEESVVPDVDHTVYHAGIESYRMDLSAYSLAGQAPDFVFRVIQAGPNVVAALVELKLRLQVTATVSFATDDEQDELVSVGSKRVERNLKTDGTIIASWDKEPSNRWTLKSVDLVHLDPPYLGEVDFEPSEDDWSDLA